MENEAVLSKLRLLEGLLGSIGAEREVAVALSGGIDSLTLAAIAQAWWRSDVSRDASRR